MSFYLFLDCRARENLIFLKIVEGEIHLQSALSWEICLSLYLCHPRPPPSSPALSIFVSLLLPLPLGLFFCLVFSICCFCCLSLVTLGERWTLLSFGRVSCQPVYSGSEVALLPWFHCFSGLAPASVDSCIRLFSGISDAGCLSRMGRRVCMATCSQKASLNLKLVRTPPAVRWESGNVGQLKEHFLEV